MNHVHIWKVSLQLSCRNTCQICPSYDRQRMFCCWKLVLLYANCSILCLINTLRPRQDGRRFPDDIFKWIFSNENVWIPIKISLKFVPKGPINNIPALVQIMAWRRPGDKPLSEPMVVSLPTHICVIRPQWVNIKQAKSHYPNKW